MNKSTSNSGAAAAHLKRIPTPKFSVVEIPAGQREDWQQPSTYIRFLEDDSNEEVNYDGDALDRRWLHIYNENVPKANSLTLDILEVIFDRLEKMRGFSQAALPPCPSAGNELILALPTKPSLQQLVDVYFWWRKRLYCRVKRVYPFGKPLLPRFEVRPDPADIQQPFHHRDIEKNQNYLRNCPRFKLANTSASLDDLQRQRDGLEEVLKVLRLIKRREQIKKEYFRVQFRIWDLRKRAKPQLDRGVTTFDAHVQRIYGTSDPLAHSLAGIKDVAQLLERCRMYEYPLHRLKVRLRPSPAAAPPHVPCEVTPCFGRLGQIIWPVKMPNASHATATGGHTDAQDTAVELVPMVTSGSILGRGGSEGPVARSTPEVALRTSALKGFTPTHGLMDDLDNVDWDWESDTDSPPRKRSYTLSQGKERFEQLEAPPFAA